MKFIFIFLLIFFITGCKKSPNSTKTAISRFHNEHFNLDYIKKIIEKKKYIKAISELEDIIKRDPYNKEVQTLLGETSKKAGYSFYSAKKPNIKKAEKYFLNSLKVIPNDNEIKKTLSLIELEKYKKAKNNKEKLKHLKNSYFYNEKNIETLNNLTDIYIKKKQFEKAILLWNKLPLTSEISQKLSDIYVKAKNTDKAEEYLNKAQELNSNKDSSIKDIIDPQLLDLVEEKCRKYYDQKKYKEIINSCKTIKPAIGKINPKLAFYLGVSYFHLNMIETAKDYLERSYKKVSDIPEAALYSVRCYEKLSNNEKAKDILLELLKIDPENSEYLLRKANIDVETKNYSQARQIYEKLMIKQPDNIEIYEKLGFLYLKSGRYQNAINQWNRALEINREKPELYFYIGAAYSKLNKIIPAINNYERAIQYSPSNPKFHYYLLYAYQRSKMYDKMDNEKNIILEIDPKGKYGAKIKQMFSIDQKKKNKNTGDITFDTIKNNYDFAISYARNAEFKKAEEYFLKVLNKDPKHIDAIINLGNVYVTDNKPEKAVFYYNKAIEIDSSLSVVYQFLSQAYINLQIYSQAKENAERSVELDNNNLEAQNILNSLNNKKIEDNINSYIKIAYVYLYNKNIDESYKIFSDVLEKNPENINILVGISKCLIEKQKYKEALNIVDNILDKNSDNWDAKRLKAKIYFKLKNYKEASKQYSETVSVNYDQNILMEFSKVCSKLRNKEKALEYLYLIKNKLKDKLLIKKIEEKIEKIGK